MKVETFTPRFTSTPGLNELSTLWHTSRTATTGRYNRMLWASREFSKAHPEVSATAAYKDLEAMLAFGGR